MSDYFNYLIKLVERLGELVGEVEDKGERDNPRFQFDLTKTIFLAEFLNNEVDLIDYHMDEQERKEFVEMKIKRDELYSRLVKIQVEVGKEKISQAMKRYSDYITRYAFGFDVDNAASNAVPRIEDADNTD